MQFPYGIADFRAIIEEGYFYVGKFSCEGDPHHD